MSLNENADILHSILRTVVLVLTPCVCNVAVGTPRFPWFFSQAILHPVTMVQTKNCFRNRSMKLLRLKNRLSQF